MLPSWRRVSATRRSSSALWLTLAGIGTALPVVIRLMEAQMGQDCVDEEAFVKAYRDLVNGIVGMMNAFRVFPKKA